MCSQWRRAWPAEGGHERDQDDVFGVYARFYDSERSATLSLRSYTPRQVRRLVDWYMRVKKAQ